MRDDVMEQIQVNTCVGCMVEKFAYSLNTSRNIGHKLLDYLRCPSIT